MKKPKELEAWGRSKARERYGFAEGGGTRSMISPREKIEGGGGGGGGGLSGSVALPPSAFASGNQRIRSMQNTERSGGGYKEYYDYMDSLRKE